LHRAISKLDHIILSALKQFSPINSKSILKSHLATYWTPSRHLALISLTASDLAAYWTPFGHLVVFLTKHSIAVVGLLIFDPAMHATDRWASVSGNHSLHNTATSSGAVEPWLPTSECK